MSVRHIVGFTLIGWYLLMPPRGDAPLSRWEIVASFDSASECRQALDYVQDYARKQVDKASAALGANHKPKPGEPTSEHLRNLAKAVVAQVYMDKEVCIATDDPRLKDAQQ